jgi:hypothetical protein
MGKAGKEFRWFLRASRFLTVVSAFARHGDARVPLGVTGHDRVEFFGAVFTRFCSDLILRVSITAAQ